MSTRRNSPPLPEEMTGRSPVLTRSRASSSSLASVNSVNSFNGLLSSPSPTTATTTTGPPSSGNTSIYYPAFPVRNKSRTPSVSSTSTITQPFHSLLQTSTGLLPQRHAAPVSAAPTLSTASATASLASPALSTSSGSPTSSPTGSVKYTMANGSISTSSSSTSIADPAHHARTNPNPVLVLEPANASHFAIKSLELPENARIKIGRQTGVNTAPSPTNGYFDSKVLSRVHAEVWSESGKVYIKDLKSSNGTFLNGRRLCPENVESEPFILNQNDHLEFGIDIMDENGALLHDKVACKIYISRMSYPTPGGSPQEAHAKLKFSSPPVSGSSVSKSRSASVSSGQSTNIDLLISRLQNELTRSQDTNADLGDLKQGLGELGRVITASVKADGDSKGSEALIQAALAVDFEKLLHESNMAHAAEIARMSKMLEETQTELDAYIQKTRLLEPLVAEDEILRRDIAQSGAELTKVMLERDLAKDSMNEIINEHQQAMDSLRKDQEAALKVLEAAHKENLERVAREAAQAQELMILQHKEELAKALQLSSAPQMELAKAEETAAFQLEISALKKQVSSLQGIAEQQKAEIQELKTEKAEAKARAEKTEKQLKEVQRPTQENLNALTPTSPTDKQMDKQMTFVCKHPGCPSSQVVKTTTRNPESKDLVARYEFSWAQFVFPMGKKNPPTLNQPSTMLMSGGFMLVGIGAYVFWHKGGLHG